MADLIDKINIDTIYGAVLSSCQNNPEKICMSGFGGQGVNYSYSQLSDYILKIAAVLKNNGINPKDRIGLLAGGSPEWGIIYLSILASGAVAVPLDPALKETELQRFFRVSEIKLLISSSNYYESCKKIISLNDYDILQYTTEPDDQHSIFGYINDDEFHCDSVSPDDMAVIIYTSGTTGDPKGVILTHKNIVSNTDMIQNALGCCSSGSKALSILPMHHTFEATVGLLHPLRVGMTIVYARALNSRDMIEDIKNNQITFLVGVPLLFEKMYHAINRKINTLSIGKKLFLKSSFSLSKVGWKMNMKLGKTLFKSLREKAGLNSLELIVCGGAPLPARVAEWFNMLGLTLIEGYGLTECSPVASANRPDDNIFGSVGPPLPGVEIKINNPDHNGIGEILLKGDNNTPGYLDNPNATAELIKDGWLYTGDLGKIEKDHLFITGREKNLIVTGGGKNVYPEEIEAELNLFDNVLESIIVGRKKHNKTGEEIWAIIVPDLEAIAENSNCKPDDISTEEIRKLIKEDVKIVNGRIADYKRIEKFEIHLEEFQKTSTRKIKRTIYK